MLAFIDKSNAPLGGTSESMQERTTAEFVGKLSNIGVEIVGGAEGVVYLNLRNLAVRNGSIQAGQHALMQALGELRAVRVDCEAMDCGYVLGQGIQAHSIARAIESGIEPVCRALQVIAPDELFTGFDRAWDFICSDSFTVDRNADGNPDEGSLWVQEQLSLRAEQDLHAHGLIDGPKDRSWMNAPPDPLLNNLDAYARERAGDVQPFRSSFDQDEY
jgi:hypothetical protein